MVPPARPPSAPNARTGSTRRLRAGDLGPGDVLVDPRLGREAEHPLPQDVLADLGGAAADRGALRLEEGLLEVGIAVGAERALADAGGPAHHVVLHQLPVRPEQVDD